MAFHKPEDLAREEGVASLLAGHFRVRMTKLVEFERIDRFAIRGDRVVAAIEIKCRTHKYGHYPTVYLAFRKFRDLLIASIDRTISPIFAVAWRCGTVGYLDVRTIPVRLELRGRTDRGANNDLEPIIPVDVGRFTLIRTARSDDTKAGEESAQDDESPVLQAVV